MSNELKSLGSKKRSGKEPSKRLSLHPLSLETALGAALQTGTMPKNDSNKAVKTGRQNKRP
jgi:hypothetical protein